MSTENKIPPLASKQLEPLLVPITDITPHPENYKSHPVEQLRSLKASLRTFSWTTPIKANMHGVIIAGHGMYQAALEEGYTHVPVEYCALDEKLSKAYLVADNETARKAVTEQDQLSNLLQEISEIPDFDIESVGFSVEDLDSLLGDFSGEGDSGDKDEASKSLCERFLVPPFSVLDTRQGYWQDRKRAWKSLGLVTSEGRNENLIGAPNLPEYALKYGGDYTGVAPQTSIFDPVLCELMYRWFTNTEFKILDPFAGGSVRGIVANYLNRDYTGIDLRQEQIDANIKQGVDIIPDNVPKWLCGDSINICEIVTGGFDFIFSCPPYADLEVYSNLENDISNMPYEQFIKAYRDIIFKCCSMLDDNRFACFVVGDIRDDKGIYRDFIGDTIQSFINSGLKLYNHLILIEQSGTASMRASKLFLSSRKAVKTHQNVLVFVKGDPKKATEACGDVEIPIMEEPQANI